MNGLLINLLSFTWGFPITVYRADYLPSRAVDEILVWFPVLKPTESRFMYWFLQRSTSRGFELLTLNTFNLNAAYHFIVLLILPAWHDSPDGRIWESKRNAGRNLLGSHFAKKKLNLWFIFRLFRYILYFISGLSQETQFNVPSLLL